MPTSVLDNQFVNLEFFPEKNQPGQGEPQTQAGAAAEAAQKNVQGAASGAQQRAKGAQQQAGQYQSQAAASLQGYGDSAQQAGQSYVQSGTDAANAAVKDRVPENAQSYAGSAVNYAGNFATATVGTVAGGVKDVGETVGNTGYSTVAGLGKTGYNLGSGLGNAFMGKKPNAETAETAEPVKTTKPDDTPEVKPS